MRNRTPLESHLLDGVQVLVKREDLCCPSPGPSLVKARGVVAYLRTHPERTFGVLDGSHSKNVWAVAWACKEMGRHCVGFWPKTVREPDILRPSQQRAADLGAELIALKAGRGRILYYQARTILDNRYPDAVMMPNALKLPETVAEVATEVVRTKLPPRGTMIVSVGTGTIASGVLRGLHLSGLLRSYKTVLHMGYSQNFQTLGRYLEAQSGVTLDGFVDLVDEGFAYKDHAKGEAPFPCNPFYELKAWNWLRRKIRTLDGPIVFWNGGD